MRKVEREKLIPIERMIGEDDQETIEFRELHEQARRYIEGFKWCAGIRNVYFGLGAAHIVGVFTLRSRRRRPRLTRRFGW